MTTELEILAQAQANEAEALKRFEAASTAVNEAEQKLASLRTELANAEASERIAAEEGKPTAAHTKRIRDTQDALRVGGYRLDRLKKDAAERQNEYTHAFQQTQEAERVISHSKLREAADAFEVALNKAAEAKRAYLDALSEYRSYVVSPGTGRNTTLAPDNVARVILQHVTCRLLDRELFTGKDYRGVPILSAADIRRDFGGDMPLIR
jgi:DNA repair exonuclease SbcCD ATPase subunit